VAADPAEVAVEVGADVADEIADSCVAAGERVDRVVGESRSEFHRVDPAGAVVFVTDDRVTSVTRPR
jgi:hypothetical protein